MADSKQLGIYLDDGLRQDVENGQHNFFGLVIKTFEGRGFEVALHPNTDDERARSKDRAGYSLFHLETPTHKRALDVRLAYMYPFWRFEKAQWREEYRVALKPFDASLIDGETARAFQRYWRKRIVMPVAPVPDLRGHVLIALQGKLLDQRHGQSMTPIDMIHETLEQDKFRPIIIKKHPKEDYSDAELAALQGLTAHPRVRFMGDDINALLRNCDYVVTQNSTVAVTGLLHNKPSILFAEADFHHLFQSVNRVGAVRAFRDILSARRSYAKYFYWYLQLNAINAGRGGAAEKILQNCRELGWEV